MSNQIITGHLEPDGSIIYVPVGFIPDFLFAVEYGVTNPLLYYWFGNEEEAAAGFAGYDTKTSGPYGITATPAAIADWVASTAYGARSATAHGDYVRATSTGTDTNGLVVDRSQLFECVTAGTSGSSEPTWPANIGGNSASDNGVVWQKVTDVPTFEGGYKGFSIAAALMT
jgi:hypothetical protein